MSDKDFYKNAMDKIALHTMEEIDTKQIRQKKKNMHARHRKMAAAVALVILITGGTVYAAKIGIFDAIFQNTKQLYNQQETEVILTTEEEHIYAVDEDGNYMILNDDGTPFDIKAAYTEARDKGYIYPYQICLDEEDYHTYERMGIFDEEDLKNSIFNDDYTEITIDGETYHLEKSYMQKEDEPKDQCVLWAFPMSNWEQRAEIFARETMLWTKKDMVIPLVEGKVKVYDNMNDELIPDAISQEDLENAEVDLYGDFLRVNGTYYVFNGIYDEADESGLILRPVEGYQGDLAYDPDGYEGRTYYSIEEWMEIE